MLPQELQIRRRHWKHWKLKALTSFEQEAMPHTPSAAGTDFAAFWSKFPQNESFTKFAVSLPEFCVDDEDLVCPEDAGLAPPKSRALTTCGWLKNALAAFSPPLNQRLCCAMRDATVWPSAGASRNLNITDW